MMPHIGFAPFGQQQVEMTFTTRRIIPLAEPLRLCGIKNPLDAAAQPRGRFGLPRFSKRDIGQGAQSHFSTPTIEPAHV